MMNFVTVILGHWISPKHTSFIIANWIYYNPNNFTVAWPVLSKIVIFMFGEMFVARQKLWKYHAIISVIKWELIESGMGEKLAIYAWIMGDKYRKCPYVLFLKFSESRFNVRIYVMICTAFKLLGYASYSNFKNRHLWICGRPRVTKTWLSVIFNWW